jgi:hypothetical protein
MITSHQNTIFRIVVHLRVVTILLRMMVSDNLLEFQFLYKKQRSLIRHELISRQLQAQHMHYL